MSFYIYGIRLGGDPECRYIGQTGDHPQVRLNALLSQAFRVMRRSRMGFGSKINPDGFYAWLDGNAGNIEAFKIAMVETRAEALATERAVVALVLRLDHRLFNRHLVPADKRIDWRLVEPSA